MSAVGRFNEQGGGGGGVRCRPIQRAGGGGGGGGGAVRCRPIQRAGGCYPLSADSTSVCGPLLADLTSGR